MNPGARSSRTYDSNAHPWASTAPMTTLELARAPIVTTIVLAVVVAVFHEPIAWLLVTFLVASLAVWTWSTVWW